MLGSAAAPGALELAGLVTPTVLLTLLCGIGVGQGITGPIAQTLQPELVPPSERPQAIALGAVNQNLASAIGPPIGGALLAATSAALVFFVNATSFLAVIAVVASVTVPARVLAVPREHVRSATRAGARFVRNSPALLPLVARNTLGLGSGGYGLLLGAVGVGAVIGATFAPTIHRALSPRSLMAA
jgi:MFS family permease